MTSLDKLKREVEIVTRAIQTKWEEDETDLWWQKAREHLTLDQQNLLEHAENIRLEAEEVVGAWMKLSEKEKRTYPFYPEYKILRPIVRSAWLSKWLLTEEKTEILVDAARLFSALRREYDSTFARGMH